MEETYILPKQLRDGLIIYLSEKPFREVADAIIALRSLAPVEAKPPKKGQ